MNSQQNQTRRSKGPSAFRAVMVLLMLAGVWIVVRGIRSGSSQSAAEPGLQINGQSVSLEGPASLVGQPISNENLVLGGDSQPLVSTRSDRSAVSTNGRSLGSPIEPFGSDLDAPPNPYADFLLSVNSIETDSEVADQPTTEEIPSDEESLDQSDDLDAPSATEFGLTAPITEPPPAETPAAETPAEPRLTESVPAQDQEAPMGDSSQPNEPDARNVQDNPYMQRAEEKSFRYDDDVSDSDNISSPSDLEPRLPKRMRRDAMADDRERNSDDKTQGSSDRDALLEPEVPISESSIDDEWLPEWQLSLREAIEIGLANNPEVQVAHYLPSITGTLVGIERGEFDPVVGASVYGGQDERLARSEVETIGASTDFLETDFFQALNGLNNLYVKQNFQSGGNYEFGYGTDYRRFFPTGRDLLLPSGWESSINVQFSQPLLRGRGKDATLRRVLVAKAQTAQARYESQANIREVVRDIELAYWQLSSAYSRVEAAKKYVKLGQTFERQENERQELGLSALPQQLQTRALLSDFTVAYRQAVRDTNIAEMQLRTRMGIGGQSFRHCQTLAGNLSNIDLPIRPDIESSVTPVSTDIESAVARAMGRPIFGIPNAKIQAARHNLAAAKNSLLPQLDATALYQKTGLDKGLDDSVSSLFNRRFDTWAVGVTLEQNVFRRTGKSSVRRFQLTIGQEQSKLDSLANQVAGLLRQYKADVEGSYDTFQARKDQVKYLSQQVEALNELYKDDKVSLFQRLEITRALQASEIEAVEVWGQMQAATARYRYARGDNPDDYGVPIQVQACN